MGTATGLIAGIPLHRGSPPHHILHSFFCGLPVGRSLLHGYGHVFVKSGQGSVGRKPIALHEVFKSGDLAVVHTFLSAVRIHDGTGPAQGRAVAVGQLETTCGLVIAAAFLLRRPVGAHTGLQDAFHAIIHTDLSAAAVKNQQPWLGAVVIHRILDHAQADDIPVGIVEGDLFLRVEPVRYPNSSGQPQH